MPPVGAFIAAAVSAVSSGISAIGGALAGLGVIGQAVGSIALSLGLSYVQSLLNRPKQQKPSDGQQEYRQSVPVRVFHYGRVKVSGGYAFWESADGSAYKALLLSSRQIDAVEQIYLNDEKVTLDSSGAVVSGVTYDTGGSTQGPNVWVNSFLGTATQNASSRLVAAFPGKWTTAHRLRGTAYLVQRSQSISAETFNKYYPNGEPALSARIRGCLVYDPRNGATEWSENAALAVLDYLTHPDGYDRPASRMDMASFAAYANLCDEVVNGQRRYRIATSISLEEPRKQVLQRLLEACDAQLFTGTNGLTQIRGGKWEAPTVTLDAEEGHIIEAFFVPPDALDRYTELAVQYLDTTLDYVENEATPWQDPAGVAAGILVTQPLDLYQVPSQSQARRLAKIRMARDNATWTGELVTNLVGLNCIGERVVRIRWPELSIDGPFWVESIELSPDLTSVNLKVRSASQASYSWTSAEEGTSTQIPPDTRPDYSLEAKDLAVSQGPLKTIVATWTASTALNRTYEARYRSTGTATWTAMTVASTRDRATSGTVSVGDYIVQVRVSAGPQVVGNWSADQLITIVEPPA